MLYWTLKFCSYLAQTIHKVPVFVSGPLLPRRYCRVITAPDMESDKSSLCRDCTARQTR